MDDGDVELLDSSVNAGGTVDDGKRRSKQIDTLTIELLHDRRRCRGFCFGYTHALYDRISR